MKEVRDFLTKMLKKENNWEKKWVKTKSDRIKINLYLDICPTCVAHLAWKAVDLKVVTG